jgi:hypothetical protein
MMKISCDLTCDFELAVACVESKGLTHSNLHVSINHISNGEVTCSNSSATRQQVGLPVHCHEHRVATCSAIALAQQTAEWAVGITLGRELHVLRARHYNTAILINHHAPQPPTFVR